VGLGSCFRRGRGTRALRIEGKLISVSRRGGAVDPAVRAPETASSAETASGRSLTLAGRAGGRGMGGGWAGMHGARASPECHHTRGRPLQLSCITLSPPRKRPLRPRRLEEITQ
ncbi:hypothetical protein LEMLEM_LOCUS27804, partial [Lemmus lemmus]